MRGWPLGQGQGHHRRKAFLSRNLSPALAWHLLLQALLLIQDLLLTPSQG